MPHMLAQEHLAWVDALRYGTVRNHTTIAAALAAIGSQRTTLILTFTGDGVWTIGANLSLPSTITLMIPAGVTLNVASGVTLTIDCQVLTSSSPSMFTGPGTVTFGTTVSYGIINFIQSRQIFFPVDGVPFQAGIPYAGSGIVTGRQVTIFTQNGANSVGLRFQTPPAGGVGAQAVWDMGEDANARWFVQRSSAQPQLVLNDVGLGIVNGAAHSGGAGGAITPAHTLHLGFDDAFKPTTNTWTTVSDNRLKDVLGPYTHGLMFLDMLPQAQRCRLNGKAGMPVDGQEFPTFIAQDLQPVAPTWVKSFEAKLEETDTAPTELLTINTNDLIYVLVNAVKELAARVEALEGTTARTRAPAAATTASEPEAEEPPHSARRKRA